jgi:hypothetical protein
MAAAAIVRMKNKGIQPPPGFHQQREPQPEVSLSLSSAWMEGLYRSSGTLPPGRTFLKRATLNERLSAELSP